jgi:NAD(P)H-dependent FMN reductase
MSKPKLLIVVASTRPGRVGRPVADWFRRVAVEHGGFEVDEADLADVDLPLLDEPNHPRLQQYTQEHTRAWSAKVDAADAFVFVTPEYNHSYPASLKNAVDYLHQEWRHKALGFVSYGGIAAGTRSVQAFKQVASALMMYVANNLVNIAFVHSKIKDGVFVEDKDVRAAADAMLDELLELDGALSGLRRATLTQLPAQ